MQPSLKAAFKILRISGLCPNDYQVDDSLLAGVCGARAKQGALWAQALEGTVTASQGGY